jgi:hypothetical protein
MTQTPIEEQPAVSDERGREGRPEDEVEVAEDIADDDDDDDDDDGEDEDDDDEDTDAG